jgi:N-carbamoyl-L-amino-acid hydrolase
MELPPGDLRRCFNADRMAGLIDRFAEIGKDAAGGVTRLSFSKEDLGAREEFIRILQTELDLSVRMDALGNIFARREGRHSDWPVIMTGSHLDSVRNGGKFDGPAGVFSSLEAFRALNLLGAETEHPFELAVLTAEEPNTFGISTFGSRGMAGCLNKDELETLRDDQGRTFRSALAYIGGDLDRIREAIRRPGEIAYFVELHIEQMPFLEREQKSIGVVEGVTGIYREAITLQGRAGHCGTTPMDVRRDALCAASEVVLALEAAAQRQEGQAVATVGRINVFPNSINVTPEKVDLDAEVRSFRPECIKRIVDRLQAVARQVDTERGIAVRRRVTYDTPPTRFSQGVIEAVQEAADDLGLASKRIVSMAGHDAAHLNRITAAGMIFIPSRDGLSHCPQEHSETQDIIRGAQCLLKTLLILDSERKGDR